MIKFIYVLCLMVPLSALLSCEKKDPRYADSCNAAFKVTELFDQNLEKNKFTKPLYTQQIKEDFKNSGMRFKKRLLGTPKAQQSQDCMYVLEYYLNELHTLRNVKSEKDVNNLYFSFTEKPSRHQ